MRFFYVCLVVGLVLTFSKAAAAQSGVSTKPVYDAELAKKLGADKIGMRNYVLVILKTGPKEGEVKGKDRDALFAGHFANTKRLAAEGKLVVAGPFGDNGQGMRGLFLFNTASVEEAKAWAASDPTIKAGVFVADLIPWYGSAALMQVNEVHGRIQQQPLP